MNILNGYKTYIVAALGIGYQLYNSIHNGQPFDVNAVMAFLGLGVLRNAIPPKA